VEERAVPNLAAIGAFLLLTVLAVATGLATGSVGLALVIGVLAILAATSIRTAAQWEKAVVLRLGRFHRLAGPGVFVLIPFLDQIHLVVDQRIHVTSFEAEQTLTADAVPVDVDAVLFWMVWDVQKVALEVANYREAVNWASQTTLRDVIGATMLADLLAGREKLDQKLLEIIDRKTEPWGIAVQSVEIRDVVIPATLQDAMSREAQAERERRARIILSTAEIEVARRFAEAAAAYKSDPVALQLRSMNILAEGLRKGGSLMLVPSRMVENLGLVGINTLPVKVTGEAEEEPVGQGMSDGIDQGSRQL